MGDRHKISEVVPKIESFSALITTYPVFTFSKLTIETLEQGLKYVQS